MIIWSGWGILVPVVAIIGFMVGIPVGVAVSGGDTHLGVIIGFVVGGLLSGVGIFALAKAIEQGTEHRYTDHLNGRLVVIRGNAGSLFFIPSRFWAFIVPVLGIAMGVFGSSEKLDADPAATPAVATAATTHAVAGPDSKPHAPRTPEEILMTNADGTPLQQGEVRELTPEESRQFDEAFKRARR